MPSTAYLMLRSRRRRRLEARMVPMQPEFSHFSQFPDSLEGRHPHRPWVPAGAGPRAARSADPGAGTTNIEEKRGMGDYPAPCSLE